MPSKNRVAKGKYYAIHKEKIRYNNGESVLSRIGNSCRTSHPWDDGWQIVSMRLEE